MAVASGAGDFDGSSADRAADGGCEVAEWPFCAVDGPAFVAGRGELDAVSDGLAEESGALAGDAGAALADEVGEDAGEPGGDADRPA